ncbi:MAG: hypothetical protein DHS80DRAFT_21619 [Piptocephalis tieghemiana]|nr:MAG: hypothetical protein DHS80DRAFT_21619 [Piptocephalis tieghemiana]
MKFPFFSSSASSSSSAKARRYPNPLDVYSPSICFSHVSAEEFRSLGTSWLRIRHVFSLTFFLLGRLFSLGQLLLLLMLFLYPAQILLVGPINKGTMGDKVIEEVEKASIDRYLYLGSLTLTFLITLYTWAWSVRRRLRRDDIVQCYLHTESRTLGGLFHYPHYVLLQRLGRISSVEIGVADYVQHDLQGWALLLSSIPAQYIHASFIILYTSSFVNDWTTGRWGTMVHLTLIQQLVLLISLVCLLRALIILASLLLSSLLLIPIYFRLPKGVGMEDVMKRQAQERLADILRKVRYTMVISQNKSVLSPYQQSSQAVISEPWAYVSSPIPSRKYAYAASTPSGTTSLVSSRIGQGGEEGFPIPPLPPLPPSVARFSQSTYHSVQHGPGGQGSGGAGGSGMDYLFTGSTSPFPNVSNRPTHPSSSMAISSPVTLTGKPRMINSPHQAKLSPVPSGDEREVEEEMMMGDGEIAAERRRRGYYGSSGQSRDGEKEMEDRRYGRKPSKLFDARGAWIPHRSGGHSSSSEEEMGGARLRDQGSLDSSLDGPMTERLEPQGVKITDVPSPVIEHYGTPRATPLTQTGEPFLYVSSTTQSSPSSEDSYLKENGRQHGSSMVNYHPSRPPTRRDQYEQPRGKEEREGKERGGVVSERPWVVRHPIPLIRRPDDTLLEGSHDHENGKMGYGSSSSRLDEDRGGGREEHGPVIRAATPGNGSDKSLYGYDIYQTYYARGPEAPEWHGSLESTEDSGGKRRGEKEGGERGKDGERRRWSGSSTSERPSYPEAWYNQSRWGRQQQRHQSSWGKGDKDRRE